MNLQQNSDRIAHLCRWAFYTTLRNTTCFSLFKLQWCKFKSHDKL